MRFFCYEFDAIKNLYMSRFLDNLTEGPGISILFIITDYYIYDP